MSQARFQKQQREKLRREKAAAKSARREERRQETKPSTAISVDQQQEIVEQLADLHRRFDAGDVELDDFLAARDGLTARLTAD